MPWPKEHKPETREHIVRAAAAAFRESGVADVGVAEIMRRAGLTHGGFYGHFSSKDELVAAAVGYAGLESDESLASLARDASLHDTVDVAEAYLSPEHLAHPERGCPLAANGPELARGSRNVRRAIGAEIRRRLAGLVERFPVRRSIARRKREAAGALACMVGGMVLARALAEPEALDLLVDVRAFVREALA
jgi:TetR/AcrR family transcriptional regulator, transcriptional repressor for nem operon